MIGTHTPALLPATSRSFFGASERGPLHRREGRPNEDAWLGARGAFGTMVVVCDGMGSKPNGREGARLGCRAVRKALCLWATRPGAPVDALLRLIPTLWSLAVLPARAEDSAATCLFAVVTPSGRLVVARLGDGLAALRLADGSLQPVGGERSGFGNETTALGIARSLREWEVLDLPVFPDGATVLLATDGVADDLLPTRWGELILHLVSHYGPMPSARRSAALRQALRAWPTPHHLDDKTLAVLF